ncbi:MAG: hypothetical protein M3134_02930, partial [Actinomycetota bacterium]|nr:hypothetical protein [Actinomycetota bacterium]
MERLVLPAFGMLVVGLVAALLSGCAVLAHTFHGLAVALPKEGVPPRGYDRIALEPFLVAVLDHARGRV